MVRFFLIAITFSCFGSVNAQIDGLSRVKMDTTMFHEGFEILDSIVEGKRIVFTGEDHTFRVSNNVFKFKLVLYLYEKGYRYFLLELGQGIGYLANDYVTTGNEKSLQSLGVDEYSKDYSLLKDLIFPLKRFNEGKSSEDQVKIIGTDYTRYPVFALRALSNIIFQSNCQSELAAFYEDLNTVASIRRTSNSLGFSVGDDTFDDFDLKSGFKSYQNQLFCLSVKSLIQSFYEDTTSFKLALNGKYDDFKLIVDELQITLNWYRGEGIAVQSHIERERHMERRILKIFEEDTLAKVAGQFGRCHIRLDDFDQDCYAFDMKSIADRVNKNELLKGKILILPIFYSWNRREVIFNKDALDEKLSEKVYTNSVFMYKTDNNWFFLDNAEFLPEYAVINTFSPYVDIKGMNLTQHSTKFKYRRSVRENHLSLFYQQQHIGSNVNNDFPSDIFPAYHQFYGLNYLGTSRRVWRYTVGFSFIFPRERESDTLNLRYTNWNLSLGTGYNWIYTSWFSFYTDVQFTVGAAKIKEDRGLAASEYTYDYEKKRVSYRNPYVTFSGASGIQFKFMLISIFGEAGYGYDVTNPKWRKDGPLQQSTGQKFGEFYFKVGLTYYMRSR